MWHWDQGRLAYFQFDALKDVARFISAHPWAPNDAALIRRKTGLEFAAPSTHSPWRNYIRIFKLCFIVSERDGVGVPTPVAEVLAQDGATTCDEYLHFIIRATTDPSPALSGWGDLSGSVTIRHPLCFSLKYILSKISILNEAIVPINEVIDAYIRSNFDGSEGDEEFHELLVPKASASVSFSSNPRQARESIKFISQLSYLHVDRKNIITSLSRQEAYDIIQSLSPINGPREADGDAEIQRLAKFFHSERDNGLAEHKKVPVADMAGLGFLEGTKVVRTHVAVERNPRLRDMFFVRNPTSVCDACSLDTRARYPWTRRILDLHHVLPLSSGTRVDSRHGTMLSDLVPICPTCHRAVHRFYDKHLRAKGRNDFVNENEARGLYVRAKEAIASRSANAH